MITIVFSSVSVSWNRVYKKAFMVSVLHWEKKLSGVRVSVFGTEGDSFDLRYIAQDILVYHLVTAHIFRFNPE